MIVRYLRKKDQNNGRGKPYGVVVAVDKDKIGWSICNNKDRWDREKGLKIAVSRANKVNYQLSHSYFDYGSNLYEELQKVIDNVKYISNKFNFGK